MKTINASCKHNCQNDESAISVTLVSGFAKSAIGVIQLIGDDSSAKILLQKFFSKKLPDLPGKIILGNFKDEKGNIIDQILLVKLPIENIPYASASTDNLSSNSKTQNNKQIQNAIYEITTHGGIRILQRIIETLKHAGATLIDFDKHTSNNIISHTYQLNNIVAQEAYKLLPKAQSALAVKFLLHQAHNGLSQLTNRNNKNLIKQAFEYWPAIRALIDGLKIVITGAPNAGKSTLTNALSQIKHALVADFPGTTRDYISVNTLIGDLAVELVDTAGLGETTDVLAKQAETQTIKQINNADVIFALIDSTNIEANKKFIHKLNGVISKNQKILALINKIDRKDTNNMKKLEAIIPQNWPKLEISALNNTNLDKIEYALWAMSGLKDFDYRKPTIFTEYLALYFSTQTN